jgi:hypothetical protein
VLLSYKCLLHATHLLSVSPIEVKRPTNSRIKGEESKGNFLEGRNVLSTTCIDRYSSPLFITDIRPKEIYDIE